MKHLIKSLFILFLLSVTNTTFAQTAKLSIQGILRSPDGSAIENGTYELKFKVYTELEGGIALWEDVFSEVEVNGGVYSVIIGSQSELDIPFDEPYFLGVSVDGGSELIPRAGLTSSPYALSLIGSDNKFPNSGNVGVGTATPGNKLTVQRGDGIIALEAVEDANNTATLTTTSSGMEFDAGGTDKVYAFNNGRIQATADELLTIEGTDDASLVITNTTGSASLGFDVSNGDDLKLSNPIGATKIEGNNISLNPSSGTATIQGNTNLQGNTNVDGMIEINKNGAALKLIGIDSSYIAFYPKGVSNGQKSFIGYSKSSPYGANDLTFYNSQVGNMIFGIQGGASTSEYIFKDGRVYIQGYKHHYYGEAPDRATRGAGRYWGAVGNYAMGLMVSYDVGTRAVNLWSDKRIKKDFKLSNNKEDLKLLQQVEVTDYRHIDEKANGTGITKGFIAQQIASIYPEAVNKSRKAIPSILAFPSEIKEESGEQVIRLEKKHELEVGSIVKVLTETKEEKIVVTRIIDAQTFVVKLSDIKANENIFIYGKEVNDFHSVDYNNIFTLNVSATQELARQVAALKKENAALKSEVTGSKKDNDVLKTELSSMNDRLKSLESIFNATGSK